MRENRIIMDQTQLWNALQFHDKLRQWLEVLAVSGANINKLLQVDLYKTW